MFIELENTILVQFPDHNCEVRAVGVTKVAGGAFFRSHDTGMVFIRIHGEDLGGTEFDANAAALAPSGIHDDFATGTFFGRQSRVMGLA
jgi:hypothetical protein